MKLFIKNRKGQKLAVVVDKTENQKGLVFVMHGLGGFKEQPHILVFADAFKEAGYTAVLFDTIDTFGESEGNYEDATTTGYYEDLEDVISWAKTQDFYQEPFCLIGHSLGGISIIIFAEKYPHRVKGLAPISTVVSGKISLESPEYKDNDLLQKWKERGWRESKSESKPGSIKRLKWSHMEDRLKYDVLPETDKLTMPILLIVGENDESTPPEHQKILFSKLPGDKEIHIIKKAPHTFRDKEHLDEIRTIITNWIKKLEVK